MKQNSAFCSVLQGNPVVASPKEQLYEQTTSNPAFPEIQQPIDRLSPRFSSGAKILGHVSHSTELVRMCLACQHYWGNLRQRPIQTLRQFSPLLIVRIQRLGFR